MGSTLTLSYCDNSTINRVVIRLCHMHAVYITTAVTRCVVCVSVWHMGEWCQNGWTDQGAIWGLLFVCPENHISIGFKIEWIHLPPQCVTRRQCGLLPNNFEYLLLLLARLRGQYCFGHWRLSLSSVVVICNAASGRAGRPPGAWAIGCHLAGHVGSRVADTACQASMVTSL